MALVLRKAQHPAGDFRRLHEVADGLAPAAQTAFLAGIDSLKSEISLRELAAAVSQGRMDEAIRILNLSSLETRFTDLSAALHDAFNKAGLIARENLPAGIRAVARFDIVNPQAVDFLRRQGARLIQGVNRETQAAIRELIREGFAEGVPSLEQARRIKEMVGLTPRHAQAVNRFRDMLIESGRSARQVRRLTDEYAARLIRWRARNIARTETINAANAGQLEAWRQAQDQGLLPPTSRKVWIVTPDDRLCPICRPIPGMNPKGVPINGMFRTPVGLRSGPTAHQQCRCALGQINSPSVPLQGGAAPQPPARRLPPTRSLRPRVPVQTRR